MGLVVIVVVVGATTFRGSDVGAVDVSLLTSSAFEEADLNIKLALEATTLPRVGVGCVAWLVMLFTVETFSEALVRDLIFVALTTAAF